jgi:hypothetical protein
MSVTINHEKNSIINSALNSGTVLGFPNSSISTLGDQDLGIGENYVANTNTYDAFNVPTTSFDSFSLIDPKDATNIINYGSVETPPGQVAYTTPGTYTWIAPAGVNSVHIVCVGGGAGGTGGWGISTAPGTSGGGGGGLGWKNNISVVSGQSYTVVVGTGSNGNTGGVSTANGGQSYFISDAIVSGNGGGGAGNNIGGTGGSYTGDGGGAGGSGSNHGGQSFQTGGGGGAGGYTGTGGSGGAGQSSSGTAGSGGGGGGGGGGASGSNVSTSGGGGGVGILGQGSDGTAGAARSGGGGGSGGGSGTNGTNYYAGDLGGSGGSYGGGGGGGGLYGYSGGPSGGGNGGSGAVRIIWGNNRSFPSTNTGDL